MSFNGNPPSEIDPATAMKAQMAMVLRQVEAQFPGCHVTVFISDPRDAKQFSYISTASVPVVQDMLGTFLKEPR